MTTEDVDDELLHARNAIVNAATGASSSLKLPEAVVAFSDVVEVTLRQLWNQLVTDADESYKELGEAQAAIETLERQLSESRNANLGLEGMVRERTAERDQAIEETHRWKAAEREQAAAAEMLRETLDRVRGAKWPYIAGVDVVPQDVPHMGDVDMNPVCEHEIPEPVEDLEPITMMMTDKAVLDLVTQRVTQRVERREKRASEEHALAHRLVTLAEQLREGTL